MPFEAVLACAILFIGLPWLILHYITKWKTSGGGITNDDEALLEELYALTKRLDELEAMLARKRAEQKETRA